MTAPPIRVVRATDPQRYLGTDQTVWFSEVLPRPAEEQLRGLPEEHRFAAEVDGADPHTYPGIYGVYPLTLSVPGPGAGARPLPCAGLTWVGVHPDHRRRGVLGAMLRHHFEQVHEEPGTFVSALHASEPAIYGRHGYGPASQELAVRLGRGARLTSPYLEDAAAGLATQLTSLADAGVAQRLRACELAHACVGSVVGAPGFYERICTERPEELRGKEPRRALFARRDGEDVGVAVFRRSEKWEAERPAGEIQVWSVAGEPAARLALLRRLVDFDLIGTVRVGTLGADDPLLLWAGGPRAVADVATYDSLWIRLVDLPEALQERAWSAPCDVVVEVDDVSAPWNRGTWRIRADAGAARVERTSAEADVRLPAAALGSAYLGGGNLVALLHAGLVAERRPGAVRELWRAMRTDLAPAAAVGF